VIKLGKRFLSTTPGGWKTAAFPCPRKHKDKKKGAKYPKPLIPSYFRSITTTVFTCLEDTKKMPIEPGGALAAWLLSLLFTKLSVFFSCFTYKALMIYDFFLVLLPTLLIREFFGISFLCIELILEPILALGVSDDLLTILNVTSNISPQIFDFLTYSSPPSTSLNKFRK